MAYPSRSPQSRAAQYARTRKPRECASEDCSELIELGSKKRLCEVCRRRTPARCKKCHKVKLPRDFSRDSTRPSGFFPWCKQCQNASTIEKSFQDDTAELNGQTCPVDDTPIRGHKNRRFCSNGCKNKVSSLKGKYGLSIESYRRLVDATDGRCPICNSKVTRWAVDHDHKTGLVTGVVCTPCNVGLLADSRHSTYLVRKLLEYLEFTPASDLGIEARDPGAWKAKKSQIHRTWHHRGKAG